MIEATTLYLIRCDHCTDLQQGDGACWYDADTDGPMLFDDAEQALDCVQTELVPNEGWTTDGTHHHCESCSKVRPLTETDPTPDAVPVIRGQIPLGADA